MRVASIIGADADDFARGLVRRLSDAGRVAWVGGGDVTPDGGAVLEPSSDASTNCVLDPSGVRISGPPRSLSAVLDELAPDHDYAIVTDHPDASLPQVVVGPVETSGEVLLEVDPGDPDLEAAVGVIDDLEPRETLESLVARAKDSPSADRSGALATFTGRVRERDGPDDDPTHHLEFETYEGVAEERMAEIAEELEARPGVFEVVMHHKTGVVEAGEDIVFVVVLAGHRDEAFATVSDGIDRLKAEVPIFKKEVTVDGEFWAHERE